MEKYGYDSHGSGFLLGGGIKRGRKLGPREWSGLPCTDGARIKTEVPDFDPQEDYTPHELLLIAEKILRLDPKPAKEEPTILFFENIRERQRKEIYTANGVPDPSFVQGMYWRTHPNGRKWREEDERKSGSGFYR